MRRLALIVWASITCLVSQAGATPLEFARHRDGFVFHRDPGDEDSDFAGFPDVRLSSLGWR